VAANKLLAKTATDAGKAKHRGPTPPRALEVVPPGSEAAYLDPLPVRALWGLAPKPPRGWRAGIKTIGDIARTPEAVLTRQFGQAGRDMSWHARGIDDRPVTPERAARSISQEITFDRDVGSRDILYDTLHRLSGEVARMLRPERAVRQDSPPEAALARFTTPHARSAWICPPTRMASFMARRWIC